MMCVPDNVRYADLGMELQLTIGAGDKVVQQTDHKIHCRTDNMFITQIFVKETG